MMFYFYVFLGLALIGIFSSVIHHLYSVEPERNRYNRNIPNNNLPAQLNNAVMNPRYNYAIYPDVRAAGHLQVEELILFKIYNEVLDGWCSFVSIHYNQNCRIKIEFNDRVDVETRNRLIERLVYRQRNAFEFREDGPLEYKLDGEMHFRSGRRLRITGSFLHDFSIVNFHGTDVVRTMTFAADYCQLLEPVGGPLVPPHRLDMLRY